MTLQDAREKSGYTVDEVSRLLGLTRQGVYHIERNGISALGRIYILSALYGVSIEELIADKKQLLVDAGQRCIENGAEDMAKIWFAKAKELIHDL